MKTDIVKPNREKIYIKALVQSSTMYMKDKPESKRVKRTKGE